MDNLRERGRKGIQAETLGAEMNQYELNRKIEEFIHKKDSKKESYSEKDIAFIRQYEGAGGQGSKGATGEGVLYEFYSATRGCTC